jgi:hypothetical protein
MFPNAAAAFALNLLRAGYTGPLFNIRRSSDNQEEDVYPNESGEIDWTALEDWVGYNLWTYSEQLQQAAWTKALSTITTDALVAPDSTTTADITYETTTSGGHGITRSISVTTGLDYAFSFWFQPVGNREFLRVALGTQFGTPIGWINMSNGVVTSQTGFNSFNVTDVGGGWYKVELTATATSTGSPSLSLNTSINGSSISFVGDVTKGASLWGLQVSETSTVKPYQRTGVNAGGEGRIPTLYCQATSRTASEATLTEQLRIITRNKVLRNSVNNLPEAVLPGVQGTRYTFSSNVPTTSPHFATGVYFRDTSTNGIAIFGNNSTGGSPLVIRQSGAAGSRVVTYRFTNNSVDNLTIPYEDVGNMLFTATRNGNAMVVDMNGVEIGSRNSAFSGVVQSSTNLFQPNSITNTLTGSFQLAIMWNQNYTTLKSSITQEINNYYGIY